MFRQHARPRFPHGLPAAAVVMTHIAPAREVGMRWGRDRWHIDGDEVGIEDWLDERKQWDIVM